MEDKMAKNRIILGSPFSRRLNSPKSQKIKRSFFKLNKKAFTIDLCRWLENFKRLSLVEYIVVLQNIINKSPAILSEAFLIF